MKKNNNSGYVLVATLLVLVALTLLGISATNITTLELRIAGNDRLQKEVLYESEGGIVLGSEVLEQNFSCPVGFSSTTLGGTISVKQSKIWSNSTISNQKKESEEDIFDKLNNSLTKYDIAYPLSSGVLPSKNVGYLYFGGETAVNPGGGLQMAAGYEGKGKGAAQGGAINRFDIYSQYLGNLNSEAILQVQWRHMIGSEGVCKY